MNVLNLTIMNSLLVLGVMTPATWCLSLPWPFNALLGGPLAILRLCQSRLGRHGASSGHLGATWDHPGAIVGPFWIQLEAFLFIWTPCLGYLGVILGYLGPSWAILGPSWDDLGPKSWPEWFKSMMLGRFGPHFGCILGFKSSFKIVQKWLKY